MWEKAEGSVGSERIEEGKEWGRSVDVTLMMRESDGEEAVYTYSVTAHVLYKGMESL